MGTQSMVARAVLVYAALGLLLFGWPRKQIERAPEPVVAVVPAQTESTEPIVDEVGREALRVALIENLRTRPAIVFEEKPPRPNPPPGFDMEPGPLTDGSRAALRAVLEDHPMILYVGPPPAPVVNPDGTKTPIEADERTGLPLQSVGDSLDPQLARFVADYNHTILRSDYNGLIATRGVRGVWSAAHRLDANADELLFPLLDDPADAYVLEADPESGRITLDFGSDQRIESGMRFVLWTRGRPLRHVLALLRVDHVARRRCEARVIRRLSDQQWPTAPALRASNPFYSRRGPVSVAVLGADKRAVEFAPRAFVVSPNPSWNVVEACVIGDVPVVAVGDLAAARRSFAGATREFERLYESTNRKASDPELLARLLAMGALPVPARLVPYLIPPR